MTALNEVLGMIAKCVVCGREFDCKRKTAKYCSNSCRGLAQRATPFNGTIEQPTALASMSNEDVLQVLQNAHACASDLSRASSYTPAPLCHSLAKIAAAFEDALRREGL